MPTDSILTNRRTFLLSTVAVAVGSSALAIDSSDTYRLEVHRLDIRTRHLNGHRHVVTWDRSKSRDPAHIIEWLDGNGPGWSLFEARVIAWKLWDDTTEEEGRVTEVWIINERTGIREDMEVGHNR